MGRHFLLVLFALLWSAHSQAILLKPCQERLSDTPLGLTFVGDIPTTRDFLLLSLRTEERESVRAKSAAVSALAVSALVTTLSSPEGWNALACKESDCPVIALAAYERGLLSLETLATMLWRHAAIETFHPEGTKRRAIRLVDGAGRPTAFARATWAPRPGALSDAQFDSLVAAIHRLPPAEQVAWSMPVKAVPPAWREAEWILSAFLNLIFFPVDDAGEPARDHVVIPSFGAMQAWLDTRHGETAIALLPQLGKASSWHLLDQIEINGRAMALPFPGVLGVEKADGMETGPFFAGAHDLFHAHFGSGHTVPAYRQSFRRIAELLRRHASEPTARAGELTEQQARLLRFRMGDLSLPSASLFQSGPEPSFADSVHADFGSNSDNPLFVVTRLIVQDMAHDPAYWQQRGLDARRFATRLGPTVEQWYESILP